MTRPLSELEEILGHRFENRALLQEALKGIQDVRDGRVATARQVLAKYKVKRKR